MDGAVFPNLKEKIESLGFKHQGVDGGNIIWGFDGVTKYFPEDVYLRDSIDGKPQLSLKIKKTTNGITVVINSVPFQEKYHFDKSLLKEEEVFEAIERYLKLL
jgi:hypothetical protein